jgi:hypothetical protein
MVYLHGGPSHIDTFDIKPNKHQWAEAPGGTP